MPNGQFDVSGRGTVTGPLQDDPRPLLVRLLGGTPPEEYQKFQEELEAHPIHQLNTAIQEGLQETVLPFMAGQMAVEALPSKLPIFGITASDFFPGAQATLRTRGLIEPLVRGAAMGATRPGVEDPAAAAVRGAGHMLAFNILANAPMPGLQQIGEPGKLQQYAAGIRDATKTAPSLLMSPRETYTASDVLVPLPKAPAETPFFNRVPQILEEKLPENVKPRMVRKTLEKAGVSKEEFSAWGVDELVKTQPQAMGKINKSRLMSDIYSVQPELKEKVMVPEETIPESTRLAELDREIFGLKATRQDRQSFLAESPEQREQWDAEDVVRRKKLAEREYEETVLKQKVRGMKAKYDRDEYVAPLRKGDNYREILVWLERPGSKPAVNEFGLGQGIREGDENTVYTATHYPIEPQNQVFEIRADEPEGDEKIIPGRELRIQEWQSDYLKDYIDYGLKPEVQAKRDAVSKIYEDAGNELRDKYDIMTAKVISDSDVLGIMRKVQRENASTKEIEAEFRKRAEEVKGLGGKYEKIPEELIYKFLSNRYWSLRFGRELARAVPDNPFFRQAEDLAFKRALWEAVSGGYDTLSWTGGDIQYERWGEEGLKPLYEEKAINRAKKHGFKVKSYTVKQKETTPPTEIDYFDIAGIENPNGRVVETLYIPRLGEHYFFDRNRELLASIPVDQAGNPNWDNLSIVEGEDFDNPGDHEAIYDATQRLARGDNEAAEQRMNTYMEHSKKARPKDADLKMHYIKISPEQRLRILFEGQPTYGKSTKSAAEVLFPGTKKLKRP